MDFMLALIATIAMLLAFHYGMEDRHLPAMLWLNVVLICLLVLSIRKEFWVGVGATIILAVVVEVMGIKFHKQVEREQQYPNIK